MNHGPLSFIWNLFLAAGSSPAVLAHQPNISDGTAVTADEAIFLDDIKVSRVIYHEVTEDAPQVWLTFEVAEPQVFDLSPGFRRSMGPRTSAQTMLYLARGFPPSRDRSTPRKDWMVYSSLQTR